MSMLSRTSCPTAPGLWLLFSCIVATLGQSDAKAVFALGSRILNDQLLMKDNLHAKTLAEFNSPAIVFNYAVPEPITYIEIASDTNVFAEVSLSYQNDIVSGTVRSITESDVIENEQVEIVAPSFSVDILIYGFKDTVLNLNPNVLLNRNTQQTDIMQIVIPEYSDEHADNETIRKFDDVHSNNIEEDEQESQNNEDEKISNFSYDMDDKIIEIGTRQENDKLLYETFETSTEASTQPMDHTVMFYYIDSNFITQVKFIIYGHYNGKSITSTEYKPPVVVYSHFSPNSLKATITDFNTTTLFVCMFVFGYSPDDVTMDYMPFLRSSSQMAGTGHLNGIASESPLERLKLLMKSKSTDIYSQKETDDGEPTLANNRLSITDNNAVVCTQTTATSAAAPNYILRSMQTNAVFNLLLLLLGMTQVIAYA